MLSFMDSFEHYVTADLMKKWSSMFGSVTIATTPAPPTGTNILRVPTATSIYKTNPNGARAGGVASFRYRTTGLASNNGMCQIFDGATAHLTIRPNASGFIEVLRGTTGGTLIATSTNAIAQDTWYHVRVKWTIADSGGTVEIFVNGTKTNWIDFTGDTRNAGNASWTFFLFYGSGGITTYVKDFILIDDDTSDGTNDVVDIEGTPVVGCVFPSTGDGTRADFTPSSGTDNGAMVDETAQDGDTTYNESDTAGHIDTYNFPALGVTGTIHGIQVTSTVRKTDAGTRTIAAAAYLASTDYAGDNVNIDLTYFMYSQVWAENPGTASPWSVSEIDSGEFGITLVA